MRTWSTHWVWVWSSFQQFLIARRLLWRSGLILARLSTLFCVTEVHCRIAFPCQIGVSIPAFGEHLPSLPTSRERAPRSRWQQSPLLPLQGEWVWCGMDQWRSNDIYIYIDTWYNGIVYNESEYLLKTLCFFCGMEAIRTEKHVDLLRAWDWNWLHWLNQKKPRPRTARPNWKLPDWAQRWFEKDEQKIQGAGMSQMTCLLWRWRCHDFRVPRTLDRCMAWTFDSAA